MPIAWGAQPPRKMAKGRIRLLAVKNSTPKLLVAVLGPLLGTMTHFVEGRSVLCEGHTCQHCPRKKTWKGFMPVAVAQWQPPGMPAKGIWEWVLVVGAETGADAVKWKRGQVYWITRPGRKHNGELIAERCEAEEGKPLPDTFNVIPYVLRATGQEHYMEEAIRLHVGNAQ